MKNHSETKTLSKVVQIDEAKIQHHLGALVCGSVEETLNAILDAEAAQADLRNGDYRTLQAP